MKILVLMLLMLFFVYLFKLLNGCLELLSYLIRLGNKKDKSLKFQRVFLDEWYMYFF